MHHLFSDDGAHLVFVDAFGITRISAPDKVKTDRELGTDLYGALQRTAAGALLVHEGGYGDKTRLFSFPQLTATQKFKRFSVEQALAHPDGKHLVRFGGGDAPGLRVTDDSDATAFAVAYSAMSLRRVEPVALGADTTAPAVPQQLFAMHPDGTFAHYLSGPAPEVVVGRIGATAKDVAGGLRVPLRVQHGDTLRLLPARDGVTLLSHSVAKGRARVARVASDGAVRVSELACVALPSLADDDTLLAQTDASHLRRVSLDGTIRTEFTLADAGDHGAGLAMAHGERAWFLPWHAEHVLELGSGRAVSRKLPDAQRPVRRVMTEFIRLIDALGAAANLKTWLRRVEFHKTQTSYGFGLGSTLGDRGALADRLSRLGNELMTPQRLAPIEGYYWRYGGHMPTSSPSALTLSEEDRAALHAAASRLTAPPELAWVLAAAIAPSQSPRSRLKPTDGSPRVAIRRAVT